MSGAVVVFDNASRRLAAGNLLVRGEPSLVPIIFPPVILAFEIWVVLTGETVKASGVAFWRSGRR
jgi:hypothetical protein